jgi:hypothetical protein
MTTATTQPTLVPHATRIALLLGNHAVQMHSNAVCLWRYNPRAQRIVLAHWIGPLSDSALPLIAAVFRSGGNVGVLNAEQIEQVNLMAITLSADMVLRAERGISAALAKRRDDIAAGVEQDEVAENLSKRLRDVFAPAKLTEIATRHAASAFRAGQEANHVR